MADFKGSFYSEALDRKVPFTAIIPTANEVGIRNKKDKKVYHQLKRTIYLLHGWDGSNDDWVLNTRINELAREHNVAFILPSGENSFYLDHPNGNEYGRFIGEELVEVTRELFNLSTIREDTWIAGLSMGGFGSLRNGFKYSDTFSKVAAFSSRILTKGEAKNRKKLEDNRINKRIQAIIESDTLADLKEEEDPYELVKNKIRPQDIFIACGLDDYIYDENKAFHKFLVEENIPHEYQEKPGGHDWDFWNEAIEEAVKWMVGE